MSKNTKAIEIKDGLFWVATSSTSKIGFQTKREAKAYIKRHSFTLGYLAIALFGLSALLQLISAIIRLMA